MVAITCARLSLMSEFLTPLRVEWVDGKWRLLAPLVYQSDHAGRTITVPEGFVTDFASVPRIPVAYLLAGGRGPRAAVVHDYAYSLGEGYRRDADALLFEALPLDHVNPVIAKLMYDAVREWGALYWKGVPDPVPPTSGAVIEVP